MSSHELSLLPLCVVQAIHRILINIWWAREFAGVQIVRKPVGDLPRLGLLASSSIQKSARSSRSLPTPHFAIHDGVMAFMRCLIPR